MSTFPRYKYKINFNYCFLWRSSSSAYNATDRFNVKRTDIPLAFAYCGGTTRKRELGTYVILSNTTRDWFWWQAFHNINTNLNVVRLSYGFCWFPKKSLHNVSITRPGNKKFRIKRTPRECLCLYECGGCSSSPANVWGVGTLVAQVALMFNVLHIQKHTYLAKDMPDVQTPVCLLTICSATTGVAATSTPCASHPSRAHPPHSPSLCGVALLDAPTLFPQNFGSRSTLLIFIPLFARPSGNKRRSQPRFVYATNGTKRNKRKCP